MKMIVLQKRWNNVHLKAFHILPDFFLLKFFFYYYFIFIFLDGAQFSYIVQKK